VTTVEGTPTLPEAFERRLQQLLGEAGTRAWQAAFAAPPPATFRLNSLRGDPAATLAEIAALDPTPLDWPADAWSVAPSRRRELTDCDAARDGRIYLQTPSSLVPVQVLDPQPGEEILDLAAAPGGKTIYMAARMQDRGRIGAVEVVKGRFHRLKRNLERCGVSLADTYLADGTGVGRKVPERFDRVLLDAPCSSEGRFRAGDPDSWAVWSPKKIREMARKQTRLARSALQALKPGGRLVYCTCTLAPEENEALVDGLLQRWGDVLEVEAVDLPAERCDAAVTSWEGKAYDPAVAGCARVRADGVLESFFVACLRKTGSLEP
jgi:16S rRNA C967 or C1407 C5-methylase (RsmB/RsmF family)